MSELSRPYVRRNIPHSAGSPEYMQAYLKALNAQVFAAMGNVCRKCGFTDPRALQIDHVQGGGRKELRNRNIYSYLRRVLKSVLAGEGKYQLLCANCNWIKRHEDFP